MEHAERNVVAPLPDHNMHVNTLEEPKPTSVIVSLADEPLSEREGYSLWALLQTEIAARAKY